MVQSRQVSDVEDSGSPQRGSAVRILIADDHPIVRRGFKQILESEADMVVVGEARDGDEALKLVRKLDRIITLDELRQHAAKSLKDFVLLRRGNRLSVMPVSKKDWDFVLALE